MMEGKEKVKSVQVQEIKAATTVRVPVKGVDRNAGEKKKWEDFSTTRVKATSSVALTLA